jgi:hypothetical protein
MLGANTRILRPGTLFVELRSRDAQSYGQDLIAQMRKLNSASRPPALRYFLAASRLGSGRAARSFADARLSPARS